MTSRSDKSWLNTVTENLDFAAESDVPSGARQRTLSDQLYDTLELLSEAFFTLDRQWCFSYLNQAAERLLARTRDDLLGRCIWEEFPEAVGTASDHGYRRAVQQQSTVRFEQHYPPLGKWFEAEAHPVPDGLAVYFRDVTERALHLEQLRQQAQLLDAANDAIIVMDLNHMVQYWNRGAERVYGVSAEHVAGRPVLEVVGASLSAFQRASSETLVSGSFSGELERVRGPRDTQITQCRWSLVRDAAGVPSSILAIHTDITQSKKLEGQFLRAQRMESIGTLAGGIAHDLNNTFTPILLAVSSREAMEAPATLREDLATIEACAHRGVAMVRQLLAFARGSGNTRTRVQLNGVVNELERIIQDTFPKNIRLHLHRTSDLWEVEADATQMHQVLTNLCVNARDAMPEGGALTLSLERVVLDDLYVQMNLEAHRGPYVLITIEDTGTGIPPELMEQIFEPFFTTKAVGQGTGLGLSTSNAIVRNHGGFVRVYSEQGRGTRFKVYLPALADLGEEDSKQREESRFPRGHGEVILVVDDELPIRQMAVRTLERHGYQTISASNGAEALSLYVERRAEIALILTDMTMPLMDGPATVVAIKALNPLAKIIGSSGLGANSQVARAFDAGMSHFVSKPYTAEGLLRKVRQVLIENSQWESTPQVH